MPPKKDGPVSFLNGLGTPGFRIALLVLVISMHPVGRQFLSTFGFEFQDQRKIAQAAAAADDLHLQVDQLTRSTADVQKNVEVLSAKVDRLEQSFTGFQVDFAKYRKELK